MEEMIEKFEEGNKIWFINLVSDISSNTDILVELRRVTGMTIAELAQLRKSCSLVFDYGARRRLIKIQGQLMLKNIITQI